MLTRWRSRVASRSSSPTTYTLKIHTAPILHAPSTIVAPSSEFPLALVVAPPGIYRRRAILIQPGEDIPIGRLYRTHPGGQCKALTARKSIRPLPSHCLALRIDAGIGMEVDVGVDVEDEVEVEVESSDRGTIEVGVDMVVGIDIRD
nr:hypothetical protein [Tanacetum cinerariifolium]